VLNPPAVIGAAESVIVQGQFVAVEHDVDAGVTVDVGRNLDVLRREFTYQRQELIRV
jgi:hypothetical protein